MITARGIGTLCFTALIGLGGAALVGVVSSAPAFNADLRQGNAFGETALLSGQDMYDRSAYLYQQAASFVRADLVALRDESGAPVIASAEEAAARARKAAVMVHESLQGDPGNAGAWTVLAWAHLMSGEANQARAALAVSWELAPYSYVLSEERIALSLALFDPAIHSAPPDLSKVEHDGLVRDSQTLWHQRILLHRLSGNETTRLGLPSYHPPQEG